MMLVRTRTKTGTFRFEVNESDDLTLLIDKILQLAPEADPSSLTFSNQPRGGEHPVYGKQGQLKDFGISHGDLIFVAWQDRQPVNGATHPDHQPQASTSSDSTVMLDKDAWRHVKEDPIDDFLEKQSGMIQRTRDPKFCRHGDKAMCDYCMPLEPYNDKYQAEKKIKHLSFHAYLRKLDSASQKAAQAGSSYLPPLEELDYKVAIPCLSGTHASWPAGICSKCQPSAITLQLQPYRIVDHVEYSSPTIIENFIDFWRRQGGVQRFGYLLGHYEPYDQVPLGMKAVVEAIHEPPQAGEVDGVEVNMEWQDLIRVEVLAAKCGLRIVGMIYTDLLNDADSKTGAVVCKRHSKSFFLSSLETMFSARMQQLRHNPSRFCKSGKFSSKFVTCVITGNEKGEIEVQAYQTSDQAMAMVDADLIQASVDPGIVRLKQEDDPVAPNASGTSIKRYVPDVFYKYKNEYNLEVQKSAKPCFPVDYLLVSLTHGFPEASRPVFVSNKFVIENRTGFQTQSQDTVLQQVNTLLQALPADYADMSTSSKGKGKAADVDSLQAVANWISDWHLLAFLHTELVGKILEAADLEIFIKAAVAATQGSEVWQPAVVDMLGTSGWQTMAVFASANSTAQPAVDNDGFEAIPPELLHDTEMAAAPSMQGSATSNGKVVCPHCTFENDAGSPDCDICGLPLTG